MSKTVSYSYVLQKACEMTGRTYPPTTEEASFFRTFIGTALRQAWEAFDWPDHTVIQQEKFAQTYLDNTVYSSGDVVFYEVEQKYYQFINQTPIYNRVPTILGPNGDLNSVYWAEALPDYSGASSGSFDYYTVYIPGDIVFWDADQSYYQCFATTTAGVTPYTSSNWTKLNPFFRTISKTLNPDGTARSSDIGEVFAVYTADPRVTRNQSQTVSYGFNPDGVIVNDQLPFVWIEARLSPPVYTSDPSTVPYRFSDIVAYRAAGQMLRVDGKVDLGNEFILMGESALADEVDKVSRQEMQTRQITVPTR